MKPIILNAIKQRCFINCAYYAFSAVRLGRVKPRKIAAEKRKAARDLRKAIDLEQEMCEQAMQLPCDIEERNDLDLMAAVHRLTAFRLSRLSYAGRYLP